MKISQILIFALLAFVVVAKRGDDRVEDSDRDVQIEPKTGEISIQSENTQTSSNKKTADKLEIRVRTNTNDGALEISVKFKSESEDNDDDSKSESDGKRQARDGDDHEEVYFRVRFQELVEFTKASGAYLLGEAVDSSIRFDASKWGNPTTPVKDANGVTSFDITYTDGTFTLKVSFFLSDVPFSIDATSVPSTALKFTMAINNYPYVGTGSRLALLGRVKSSVARELEHEDDESDSESGSDDNKRQAATKEEAVALPNVGFAGTYSWAKTLTTPAGCNVIADIGSGNPDGDEEPNERNYKAVFTFDCVQPNPAVWDPTVGVKNPAAQLVISLIGLVAVVIATVF